MRKVVFVLLLAGWILTACGNPTPSFRGTVFETARPVQDFSLTDQNGQPFRLSDQKGRVVVLFFGYTFCPDVCPTTLGTWTRVHEALGKDADQVRFVFVTVDPERDTPERLKQHVEVFNREFVGLTGAPYELERVYRTFGVFREKETSTTSATDYLVSHTAATFVLDPEGQWRLRHSYGMLLEDVIHDISHLLK